MSHRQTIALVAGAALIGGAALLGVWRWQPASPAAAATAAPQVAAVEAMPPRAAQPGAPLVNAAHAPAPTRPRLVPCDPKQVVLPNPQAAEAPATAGKAPGSALFAAVGRTLASSSDATARAAALFMASVDNSIDMASCVGNDCSEAVAHRRQASAKEASALASLVHGANLPSAYAWALTACRAAQADALAHPACAALSLQRWAQVAPDNAWPWLALAHEALQRSDVSGLESAMHRAALARDWSSPEDEIRRLMVAALPADARAEDFLGVLVRMVGAYQANLPGLSALTRYCNAQQDANRRQTCARLAGAALDSARDLMQLSIAIKVGERSGLAAERLEAAATRKDQAHQALAATVGAPSGWTWENAATQHCRFVDQQAQVALRSAEVGEVAAALELLQPRRP